MIVELEVDVVDVWRTVRLGELLEFWVVVPVTLDVFSGDMTLWALCEEATLNGWDVDLLCSLPSSNLKHT